MLRMSLFPETPGTLLRKIADLQAGDDAAVWADFVERYLPAVRAFIRLNGAPENEQDDLVQEVFVKLVGILRTSRYDAAKARFRPTWPRSCATCSSTTSGRSVPARRR